MWRVTAKGTLSRLPLLSDLQTLEANQWHTLEEDNKFAQLWVGHLGTKESNKRAIPPAMLTITQSIQDSTVLGPLILLST